MASRTRTSVRGRKHREGLCASGLRSIQISVPDVRSRAFAVKAHRQSLAVATSAQQADEQGFIDSTSDRG